MRVMVRRFVEIWRIGYLKVSEDRSKGMMLRGRDKGSVCEFSLDGSLLEHVSELSA